MNNMDYKFTFSDPATGTIIVQKLSQMNKDYKSVKRAFYAFRRHTARFMNVTLKYTTQFSKMEELQ